ncbi:uncharacterized protein TRAVEDRAFT_134756, partial [Trametes versicolor FP-101664 SS1]|uniref:uncharacterized protein n=1 Tax=Trametes versicolor (strain FP-101664) TaxID=717944 RepID=UPI0004621836
LQSPATTVMTSAGESASFEAWTRCATAMKDHEDARIEAWKEEIDAELVFAALFSAILTAFDVEAYKMLQPQNSNNSSPLTFITIQADGTQQINASALMSILAAQSLPTTGPSPRYSVAINALWFSALICSLAAASISILVRQWLNQYTSGLASVSPEIARVRQFRRDNLKKWRVAEIMMLLPVLLQGAMVLFLIGLVLFLEQLNTEITYIATILVAILLFFILLTTILPTFNDDCSYQSPQAWGFFVIFQGFKRPLRSICRSISAWVARERMLVEASGSVLDQHLVVEADATFLDDAFLRDVVRPCLDDMPPDAAMKAYYNIMTHRADRIEGGVPYFDSRNGRTESVAVLTDLTLDALHRTRGVPTRAAHDDALRTIRILEPLLVRALPLTYDHFCRVFFALSNDPDEKVRHVAFNVLYHQLWRNLELADVHFAGGCHGTCSR